MILKTHRVLILTFLFVVLQSAWATEMSGAECSATGSGVQNENMKSGALTPKQLFSQSYAEAECLRRAAAAMGFEWLETENLLLDSLKEADEERWESALTMVKKAHLQSAQALLQAEREEESWKNRVID